MRQKKKVKNNSNGMLVLSFGVLLSLLFLSAHGPARSKRCDALAKACFFASLNENNVTFVWVLNKFLIPLPLLCE